MKPDDGYIAYIVNPKSGASSSEAVGRRFEQYLVSRGFKVKLNLTTSLTDACELATDAAVDYDCAMAVVVGGDGTVREVAHGLEGSDKPLLIVPSGTENLLANELGFDEKLKTVIGAFEAGCIRPLDLGSANGRCFTSIVGFGFDGRVVERVSWQRRAVWSLLVIFHDMPSDLRYWLMLISAMVCWMFVSINAPHACIW
jgi:diacylglycerol kinase (ATP)